MKNDIIEREGLVLLETYKGVDLYSKKDSIVIIVRAVEGGYFTHPFETVRDFKKYMDENNSK